MGYSGRVADRGSRMPITVSVESARDAVRRAFAIATSGEELPETWLEVARRTFAMQSKTYTPALGAVLTARATTAAVDPLSIKQAFGPTTYSLRSVGHLVLVPLAQELGFSIRTTKREPLNNQPFFRYSHMSEMNRVAHPQEHLKFVQDVRRLRSTSQEEALKALAAYIRVGVADLTTRRKCVVTPGVLTPSGLVQAASSFMRDTHDRPKRAQAIAAAAFSAMYDDVRSRAINDPSRDVPGDVQAYVGTTVVLSVEVRAKRVSASDVEGFTANCRDAGVERAFMVVTSPDHQPLDRVTLEMRTLNDKGITLCILESIPELVTMMLTWSPLPLPQAIDAFAVGLLAQLREIEATQQSLARWAELASSTTPAELPIDMPLAGENPNQDRLV